ncbi:hypothetical protein ACN38_g5379 [Penicillium nordicum]|uniref:Uncharacterized protein n=1 Tax=Penicillium nordicum TaxID=229535 RepID=A0A0M9WG87_9EURO|nr:hypothetical protein ACN38_g5379 [Penicillium nordicum]
MSNSLEDVKMGPLQGSGDNLRTPDGEHDSTHSILAGLIGSLISLKHSSPRRGDPSAVPERDIYPCVHSTLQYVLGSYYGPQYTNYPREDTEYGSGGI